MVDAKSLLGVLALALQPDQEIEIDVNSNEIIDELLALDLFEKL